MDTVQAVEDMAIKVTKEAVRSAVCLFGEMHDVTITEKVGTTVIKVQIIHHNFKFS